MARLERDRCFVCLKEEWGVTRLGRQWFSSVPRGVRSKDRKRGAGGSRQGVRDDRHGRLYDRRTISLSRARMGKP